MPEIKVLSRKALMEILEIDKVIENVKDVYTMKGRGGAVVWPLVDYEFEERGGMDIRSGYIKERRIHGLKMLNFFWDNPKKDLPMTHGLLTIHESDTGLPLGVMDAFYITGMRTGSAGALGVKYLARENSETLLLLGAGKQGVFQIAATLTLMPRITRVFIADALSYDNAVAFAARMPSQLKEEFGIDASGVTFEAADSLERCVPLSDAIITITPSTKPVIRKEWVKPGTHFSCVGSDKSGKEELDPEILRGARIFTDDTPQCIRVGEIELAIKQGILSPDDIAGEFGKVLEGTIPGRQTDNDITVFDITGIALLDLMTGKTAIDLANQKNLGVTVEI